MLGHRSLKPEEYVAILKRRGLLILIPALVLPVLAFGLTYLIPPQYVSQTLVLVEEQKVPDDYVKPVVSADLDQRLASMKEQILSRSSIRPIIERYNLYAGQTMDKRLDSARKNIEVKPIHPEVSHATALPGFFISFKASDPVVAKQVCGDITSLFLDENLKAREQSAQGTTEFLQAQLAEAKGNLDAQDAKMADFQKKYVGQLPGDQNPNMDMLTSLNTQLEANSQQLSRMEQDRTYQQSLLAQQTSIQSPAVLRATDERQAQLAALEQQNDELSARYTDSYPDVVDVRQKIAELKRDIASSPKKASPTGGSVDPPSVQQLRASIHSSEEGISARRAEQAQIERQIHQYQDRISSSPLVEEQYKEMTRDYQTAQKFYDDLLAKMNQSKMATDLERRQQGEQFRVLDEPNLPDAPAFPKRGLFAAGGAFLGLLLGFGLAALLEYRDTSIRSEEDIHALLELPILAAVPYASPDFAVAAPSEKSKLLSFFQRS